ncbi:hypothetical protein ABV409_02940 [Flagellimonas sp. DF-77]|uniref:hypothetical protein n=1 Tax=Flagellimonas algarum TaxID=3230298 RepID=UPI003399E6E0
MQKVIRSITIAIFGLLTTNLQAQVFEKVGGQATDIAMNPKTGKVFVVSGRNIFTDYDSRTKRWKLFSSRPNNAESISITKQGVVYITSTSDEVFIEVNGKWIKVPGIKTKEVICERYGLHIYAIDEYKKLRYLRSGKWTYDRHRNKGVTGLKQLVTMSTAEFFATNNNNEFMEWVAGKWRIRNGKPNQIALDHKTGAIYAIGQNRGIYKWNKNTDRWSIIPNTRKDFVRLAVHDGVVWAVTVNNAIYYADTTKKAKDFSGTYEVIVDRLGAPKKRNKYYGTIGIYLSADTKSGRAMISPTNGQKNRLWDIPKQGPSVAHENGFSWTDSFTAKARRKQAAGSLEIGRSRKFKLVGEAAKGYPEFDFQFNVKEHQGDLPGIRGVGLWEREKIKMEDLVLGKTYYRHLLSSDTVISFRVEKL